MRVAVTGSSGLIGTALVRALEARGDEVVRIVRSGMRAQGRILWDPERGHIDRLDGIDAAVNLAGEPIGRRRWTEKQKRRITSSRELGTAVLARAMTSQSPKPRVLLNASAMGFYGERGDDVLTEDAPAGTAFLASVCRRWEAATSEASDAGIRVVLLRTGLVLSPDGGLLGRILLPFWLGAGGRLGNGRQWMSWVTLRDEVGAILHLLDDDGARGPYNISAPHPVRNDEFTRVLARVLHRPAFVPIPKALIAIPFGRELADDLLSSTRMAPARLMDAGHRFEAPELEPALRALLGR